MTDDERKAGRALQLARERYQKWRENIFQKNTRQQRAGSACSDRTKREVNRTRHEVESVKAVNQSYVAGVDAINESASAKGHFEIVKDEQDDEQQERRRLEYINWHISKYGRPPNPNFFRGVSESGSERSRSAGGRSGRGGLSASELSPRNARKGKYSALSNLDKIKLGNFNAYGKNPK